MTLLISQQKEDNIGFDTSSFAEVKYNNGERKKLLPKRIMLLSFNYTKTAKMYNNFNITHNYIHGELEKPENIIFGYGDELDKSYQSILDMNDNELLRNVKSVKYLETRHYHDLLEFLLAAPFQVLIMGHSCGNSDRTLLNTFFEISVKELEESPLKEHEHTFFELVYILSGTGLQCINNNKFDYHEGHMFLITPQDCHSFDIHTTTKFFFIRFNDIYIYIHSGFFGTKNIKNLEFILQHANHQPGCILKNITDKPLIKSIIEALIREYVNQDLYNKELIQQLINTLIVIVTRNIAKYLPEKIDERSEEKTLDILQYIQNNIYNPDKIKADTISQHFGISQNYLGRYFKKHTNETMQQYIIKYKLKLVENRLLHSEMRINEIAAELGFTDESHLNKLFKKYKGVIPSEFRKRNL